MSTAVSYWTDELFIKNRGWEFDLIWRWKLAIGFKEEKNCVSRGQRLQRGTKEQWNWIKLSRSFLFKKKWALILNKCVKRSQIWLVANNQSSLIRVGKLAKRWKLKANNFEKKNETEA